MIPVEFAYVAPDTLEEAVRQLSGHTNARVLAGGQSLLTAMKLGRAAPALLVDLRKVSGLAGIGPGPGGGLRVGAMATYDAVAAVEGLGKRYPALADVLEALGDPQVRNRATIGGGLANAGPADDLPAVALALGAIVQTAGPAGPRAIPADELFVGPFRTALGPAEVITAVDFPAPAAGTGSAYVKLRNPASGYAICGVAAVVGRSASGTVDRCRVAVVGATDHAVRLRRVEEALAGKAPTAEGIAAAAKQVSAEGLTFVADLAASAEYRAHLAEVLAERAIGRAVERT